jgi:hypothetical protein
MKIKIVNKTLDFSLRLMPFSLVYTSVHITFKTADLEVKQSSPCNGP